MEKELSGYMSKLKEGGVGEAREGDMLNKTKKKKTKGRIKSKGGMPNDGSRNIIRLNVKEGILGRDVSIFD